MVTSAAWQAKSLLDIPVNHPPSLLWVFVAVLPGKSPTAAWRTACCHSHTHTHSCSSCLQGFYLSLCVSLFCPLHVTRPTASSPWRAPSSTTRLSENSYGHTRCLESFYYTQGSKIGEMGKITTSFPCTTVGITVTAGRIIFRDWIAFTKFWKRWWSVAHNNFNSG